MKGKGEHFKGKEMTDKKYDLLLFVRGMGMKKIAK